MTYNDKIHRLGKISLSMVLLLVLAVPFIVSLYFDIFPPVKNILKGLATVAMVYLPIATAEFLTYTPMLGSGATYLAFVTGNLSNLKVPCALSCIENAGVPSNSEEAEIIATIAVAVSSIVTMIIIVIGLLTIAPLQPLLEAPVLKPAFNEIIPALFGAMGGYWILKYWKLSLMPLPTIVLIYLICTIPVGAEGVLIPVMGLGSVLSARIMYKKGFLK